MSLSDISRALGAGGIRGEENGDELGESFTADAADKTGQSERKIQRGTARARKLGKDALRQVVGTVLDKPEQLNALAKMDEPQREAPDLAGRRMRYPGSASRARRTSTGPGPGPLTRRGGSHAAGTSRKPGIGSPADLYNCPRYTACPPRYHSRR